MIFYGGHFWNRKFWQIVQFCNSFLVLGLIILFLSQWYCNQIIDKLDKDRHPRGEMQEHIATHPRKYAPSLYFGLMQEHITCFSEYWILIFAWSLVSFPLYVLSPQYRPWHPPLTTLWTKGILARLPLSRLLSGFLQPLSLWPFPPWIENQRPILGILRILRWPFQSDMVEEKVEQSDCNEPASNNKEHPSHSKLVVE